MFGLIVGFVFFLSVLPLPAQQLAKMQIVGKPEKSATEIVAVRDANGRYCAAVQVISDMDGFRYDSYNGVVKVDDQPGKDMVYLQPDERVLEIFKSGYEPMKIILSEIGIQLKPKEVWKIKLAGEKSLSRIPSVFITRPEGARIYIDGEDKGITKKVTLSKGTHTIRLTKSGYEPVLKTIQVDEENTLFEYTLKEIEDVPLQITTEPTAATVFIDNLKFGQTPLSDFYPSGKYPVRVEKEWYVTYEDFIEINAPNTKQNYKLRADFGSLTVTSAP